jgi:hypothetical protein
MAIQEIISSIDAYITRLKTARDLLASLHTPSETRVKEPRKRTSQGKPQSIQLPIPQSSASEVPVQIIPAQIIPAKVPRQRQRLKKQVSQTLSALGGPVPNGPVVVRSSDLARTLSGSSQAQPTVPAQKSTPSLGALEELAQEVAKRLAFSTSNERSINDKFA